jgi:uncharacterized membrane protein YdfJ with MMPL/SSD domain
MMLVPALVASMGNANWWLRPTPERLQTAPRLQSPAEETSRAH